MRRHTTQPRPDWQKRVEQTDHEGLDGSGDTGHMAVLVTEIGQGPEGAEKLVLTVDIKAVEIRTRRAIEMHIGIAARHFELVRKQLRVRSGSGKNRETQH